eukprot:7325473-Prorocentrum_lima.AAC.1
MAASFAFCLSLEAVGKSGLKCIGGNPSGCNFWSSDLFWPNLLVRMIWVFPCHAQMLYQGVRALCLGTICTADGFHSRSGCRRAQMYMIAQFTCA